MLVLKAVESGKEYPVATPRVTVGRDPSNDVVLDDGSVSGFHAVLFLEDGVLSVSDLGSTNGTRVAGVPAAGRVAVAPWTFIEFGGLRLEVRDPNRRAPTRVMPAVSESGAPEAVHSRAGAEAADPSGAARLVLRSEGSYPASIVLSGTLNVGRAPDSGLRLAADTVSARHATITSAAGAVEVIDAGSTNGTWVNGERISRRRLRHGDRVRFDTIEYELQDPDGGLIEGTRVNPAVELTPEPTRVASAVPGASGLGAPTRVDPMFPETRPDDLHARPTQVDTAMGRGYASATVLDAAIPDEPIYSGTRTPDPEGPFGQQTTGSPAMGAEHREFGRDPVPRRDDRVSTLFALVFSHYAGFLPGVMLLAAAALVGLGFNIYATGGLGGFADPGQFLRQPELAAGSEAVFLLGSSLQGFMQIGALFLLLRAAGGALHVQGLDRRQVFLRFLAYLGTWVLAIVGFTLALVAVSVPLVVLMATLASSAYTGPDSYFGVGLLEIAPIGVVVFVLLYLRLWPPLVQVALYRARNPFLAAWNETGQPGALKRGSWPLLGWMLLSLSPIVAVMPFPFLAGAVGLVLASLVFMAWVGVIAPFLALLAVSRWQRIALSQAH